MKFELRSRSCELEDDDDCLDDDDYANGEEIVVTFSDKDRVYFDIYSKGLTRWWVFNPTSAPDKLEIIGIDEIIKWGKSL